MVEAAQEKKSCRNAQTMSRKRKTEYLSDAPGIIVKNSGSVDLQIIKDHPDGKLYIAEEGKNIPFGTKRAYFINELYRPDAIRGKHAHKKLQQVIFCIKGSFKLHLDDGEQQQDIVMDTPSRGVFLGPSLWHDMTHFSPDCVILVLASNCYDENDYIRDYAKFLEYINERK